MRNLMIKVLQCITVGISLLANFARSEVGQELGISEWIKLSPQDPRQQEVEAHAHRGDTVLEGLLEFLKREGERASAEYNALSRFEQVKGLRPDQQEVVLYSTDTGTGWLCAMALYHFFRERGYRLVSEPVRIRRYGWGPDFMGEALLDLVEKLVKLIVRRKREGYRVYVNATGGFKPESAFVVMASLLAGADSVYYIHETFRDIVELPAVPLWIRPEYLEVLEKLVEPVQLHYARNYMGLTEERIRELEERGLVEVAKGRVAARPWVRSLISALKRA